MSHHPQISATESSPIPTLAPEVLNIEDKQRSNLFSWRGQFSPQLVEAILKTYPSPETCRVLDPFMGSGTVLVEAARLDLPVVGIEVNPSAKLLAQIYEYANFTPSQRSSVISDLDAFFTKTFEQELPLFGDSTPDPKETLAAARDRVAGTEAERILDTFIVTLDLKRDGHFSGETIQGHWESLKSLVSQLPYTEAPIKAVLGDARSTGIASKSVDFVLTSPPYINVFNYHQQYRKSVEFMGWDVLKHARSEIGSNRKNRRNRFLTVIQYCLDMDAVLREISRVSTPCAEVVMVVGRESNVNGTPFYNSKIIRTIAEESGLFETVLVQERVFKNRFGRMIYEDLLHFHPRRGSQDRRNSALDIARTVLEDATTRVPDKWKEALQGALDELSGIAESPILST